MNWYRHPISHHTVESCEFIKVYASSKALTKLNDVICICVVCRLSQSCYHSIKSWK